MDDSNSEYKAHILLVDDGQVNRMLGEKILNKLSYQVSLAKDGLDAIEIIESQPSSTFSLVLMDLEMPRLSGIQAAQIIRERKLTYAPIFALTSHQSEKTRILCREAKMNGYIQKPLKLEILEEILDRLFL
ncbi:MAG: response regulator [Pseudomonadota bacterium]